jgi:hypothetical protein
MGIEPKSNPNAKPRFFLCDIAMTSATLLATSRQQTVDHEHLSLACILLALHA